MDSVPRKMYLLWQRPRIFDLVQILSCRCSVIRDLKYKCSLGNGTIQSTADFEQSLTCCSGLSMHNPIKRAVIHIGFGGQLPQRFEPPHVINPHSKRAQFLSCLSHHISPHYCLTCNIAWCTISILHAMQSYCTYWHFKNQVSEANA